MNLRDRLRRNLRDTEYRHGYADEHLNLTLSTQIKMLREQRGWSQAQLASKIGTKQTGVSRLENVNYSRWSISTLRKIARAFDLRLKVSLEVFGSLWEDVQGASRSSLQRPAFEDDPEFSDSAVPQAPVSIWISGEPPTSAVSTNSAVVRVGR